MLEGLIFLEQTIINLMNEYGYFSLFFLIIAENIFPPIPSELVLTLMGFMTTITKQSLILAIIISTIASLCGAYLLYFLGRILSKEKLIAFTKSKYGKWLNLKPKDIEKADEWFSTKGNKTVLYCRFIPLLRSLISIPAGINRMSMIKFGIYTLLGSFTWNSILILIGAFVGEKRTFIVFFLKKISFIISLILLLSLFIILYKFKIRKEKK